MEAWVSTVVLGFILGALAFLMKKQLGDIERNIEKNHQDSLKALEAANDRIDKLEIKLQNTIEEMPYRYTLREDFIRAVTGLDAKLDKILDKVGGKS